MVGQTVAHYRILERLGGGGMGVVYRAEDLRLGRHVAIKVLPPELSTDPEAALRFRREARAASALNHPNICTVHDFGEHEGQQFLVMELLDGRTLKYEIERRPLPIERVVELGAGIADALDAAHAQGIVHRDLKPANIFVSARGHAKVLDFGLAKLMPADTGGESHATRTTEAALSMEGAVLGTAGYMSPEQARGETVDARTDVFSLGAVLYEMVTGTPAFARNSAVATLDAVLNGTPPAAVRLNPAVPPDLERLIERCLEKDRNLRCQTAAEVRAELRRVGRAPATRAGAPAGAEPRPVRRRLSRAALALAIGATAAGGAYWLAPRTPALTEEDEILVADFENTTGEPVFDDALRRALTVQLQQSPFLSVVSDERVRETLRFMGRAPDETLTGSAAREVCQRQDVKAMIAGSIARLGTQYALTLDALNCATGDSVASEQAVAARREEVLARLGTAASALRGRLGESLSTLERFDVPIERATTPSLDALKAFSMGYRLHSGGEYLKAIAHLERATSLDPQFALAYAQMSTSHNNARDLTRARELAERAYALRDRVTERERLYIETRYHGAVSGDIEAATRVHELWVQTYTRDGVPWNNLGVHYGDQGEFDRALEAYLQARRLMPDNALAHHNVAFAYFGLNRLAEARRAADEGLRDFPGHPDFLTTRMSVACRERDEGTVNTLLEEGRRRRINQVMRSAMFCAIWNGRLADARRLWEEAAGMTREEFRETRAAGLLDIGLAEWRFGDRARARALVRDQAGLPGNATLTGRFAAVAAEIGDADAARGLIERATADAPRATLLLGVWAPLVRAQLLTAEGKAAEAIALLPPIGRFERRWGDLGLLRAQVHFEAGDHAGAVAAFRRVLDNPPAWPPSPSVYPAAMIGLARSLAASGDRAAAREAYERFLDFWKNADRDLRVLADARRELGALH